MEAEAKVRKPTGTDIDRAQLAEIASKMRSWSDLAEEISGELPGNIVAALGTGRPELVTLFSGEFSRAQVGTVLRLCAVLMETNLALQQHASEVASRVESMDQQLRGLLKLTHRIGHFANFRTEYED